MHVRKQTRNTERLTVHFLSWLMTAEPKGYWTAKRYNIVVMYLQVKELAETCLPSFVVYIKTV